MISGQNTFCLFKSVVKFKPSGFMWIPGMDTLPSNQQESQVDEIQGRRGWAQLSYSKDQWKRACATKWYVRSWQTANSKDYCKIIQYPQTRAGVVLYTLCKIQHPKSKELIFDSTQFGAGCSIPPLVHEIVHALAGNCGDRRPFSGFETGSKKSMQRES